MDVKGYKSKESNLLYGKDLDDAVKATITAVGTHVFVNEDGSEREAVELSVESDAFGGIKSFCVGSRIVDTLSEAFGDESNEWIGKSVTLTPVKSQTPQGQPTVSIAVTVPRRK